MFSFVIADMICSKKFHPIVTELFFRGWILSISVAFIWISFFAVPNNARINTTYFFIMEILNRREFQQIGINHSSFI